MKALYLILATLLLFSCNNPQGKIVMSPEEFGVGGFILLGCAIAVFPVTIYLMKRKKKK
jgi:hypothetical protein